jgi:4-hydroxy-4-methyl-2-oxoglutarate aldolase
MKTVQRIITSSCVLAALAAGLWSTSAQVGVFTKDQLIEYTPDWKGDRLPDGRPKVSDDILQRMKAVSIEEAWQTLRDARFNAQFESGWVMAGPKEPVLVGRALTAYFFPIRPDINGVIGAKGKADGRVGAQNSWVIDASTKGDVLVVDLMGKVIEGTFMGDNLGNSIAAKTGTGIVINGGARDLQGNEEIPNFPIFNRGWDPSAIANTMLMGINTPIRIGRAVVMPGDVVLGKKEGLIFIPAHLAQRVVEESETTRVKDDFGHQRLQEGKYTPGQIDRAWTAEINADFKAWLKERADKLTPYQRQKLLGTDGN